ncbi:beta strand repeat-containing protein [Prosthecobacter debontii]|nr:autotransporter-associated beta strand repeat-containing protein [Prosthecobacter debontii]
MKRFLVSLLFSTATPGMAELIFDANTGSTGAQNGAGVWDATTENWWDAVSLSNKAWDNAVAQFGSSSSAAGGNITINTAISATGLNFLALSAAPTTSTQAYAFVTTGSGTLSLTGSAPVINIANGATSGSSVNTTAINFQLPVIATNLAVQKSSGTSIGYARFTAVNTDLTGPLTAKGQNGGIFLSFGSASVFPNVSEVVIESNSVAHIPSAGGTYSTPFRIAGSGGTTEWGAIRLDATSSVVLSGGITLAGDARVHTHTNVVNSSITAPIVEDGGSFAFTRTALLPTTATAPLSMTYTAANTYTGATNFGRAVTPNFPTALAASEGGLNVLAFNATGAPESNIFYSNTAVAAGALNLFGGHGTVTVLRLQGKDGTVNNQRFGNVTVAQNLSEIELISGSGGTVNLTLGSISRTGNGLLSVKAPVSGSITTSTPSAFLGAWATFTAADGSASWAAAPAGVLTGFTGDTVHQTGTALSEAPVANLRIGNASTADVTQGAGTVTVNTLSMTDTWVDRTVSAGGGTLRLGTAGGIQIVTGARNLTLSGGKLTAGGADNTAGQVLLTNLSNSRLTVNSVIENNGSGAVTLLVNGTGVSALTAANTYTGQTILSSGSLEISHANALGSSASASYTQILTGASLLFSGDITTAERIIFAGRGVGGTAGALRNVSGNNTITTEVQALTNGRIHSESGTLTFAPVAGLPTSNAINGAGMPMIFSGNGDIVINGRLNIVAGTITKEGTGALVLNGDNSVNTGAITVNAGILRVGHSNAMGGAGSVTIASGAALELSGGITAAKTMTVGGTGIATQGAIRSLTGSNTLAGVITLSASLRLQAEAGSTLNFDVASGNAVQHAGSATLTLTLAGNGTLNFADPIAKTSTGTLSLLKTGNGTANIKAASTTLNGSLTANGGILNLDYSAGTVTGNMVGSGMAMTLSGGVLQLTGRSAASVTQTFGAVTVAIGQSEIRVVQNGGTNVNLALGAIGRPNIGGSLRFTPGTGTLTTTGGTDNTALMFDSMLFATVGSSDWAATGALSGGVRNIVGLSTLPGGGYTTTTSTGGTLSGHADVTTSTASVPESLTINSLRFNTSGGSALSIASGKILSTGGILVGPEAGAFETTISGGTLRSSSTGTSSTTGELLIIQNNTAAGLAISSVIANSAVSTTTSFTKGGPGTVYLDTVNHTYAGTTRVLEGMLHIRSGNISASGEITLGSGANSGVLKLGDGSTAVSVALDWLRIDGTGTGNAVVGGSTAYSTFTLDNNTVASDFRNGRLGGDGVNEDNLNFRTIAGVSPTTGALIATLGPANTYKGKTSMLLGTIEATLLADVGFASSLGKGDRDADAGIIEMSAHEVSSGTAIATSVLRYIGSTDSSTNREIRIHNNDTVTQITEVSAVLENTGTGSVKFTTAFTATGANTATRQFRLGGTNTGANEIVGISDAPNAATSVEKLGTGTWIITGDSPHSGGTTVTNGLLQLGNGGSTGSVAGSAITLVAPTSILSTRRSGTLTLDQAITGSGTLRIDNLPSGITRLTSDLNTYASTLVQSGTLLANNASSLSSATGTGSVIVRPGAVLGGTGRIAPAIHGSIVLTGATLSVGDSSLSTPQAADLTLATTGTGLLSLQAASIFAFDLFSGAGFGDNTLTAGAADLAVISGGLALGTDITLRVSNPTGMTAFAAEDSWRLFDWSGLSGLTGNFTRYELPTLSEGLAWDLSQLYSHGVLSITVSVVPEPSRMLLLVLGLGGLIVRRRRGRC